jgi:hypothetical protein
MTPERIAELRGKYERLAEMMAAPDPWSKTQMLETVGYAFAAAKTIPSLLDEIERLRAGPVAAAGAGEVV